MQQYAFDTVILGGGPAGLSAGIYAARSAATTAIIDISSLGGQPVNYLEIENYPGFGKINGFELAEKFEQQAQNFGVQKFEMQELVSINLTANPKIIKTKELEIKAKTVIIATGAKPMKLGVPGEEDFIGRGVSYCAVCDGAFYKDKIVTVIGGGNSALEEAIYLTGFAKKVYIVHRRDELRADKIVQKRAFDNKKIEFIYNSIVKEIHGNEKVEEILIENTKTKEYKKLLTDGVFPYIGITPNVEVLNGQIEQTSTGFILTDETMQTSQKGVYAAGDVRQTPLRQVITACSDGAIAAVYATKYLNVLKGIPV